MNAIQIYIEIYFMIYIDMNVASVLFDLNWHSEILYAEMFLKRGEEGRGGGSFCGT